MINNIQEIHVSFRVAKLLKENGFDCNVAKCYAEERILDSNTGADVFTGVYYLCVRNKFHKRYFQAPTQQLAIDWIRVNLRVHIHCLWSYADDRNQYHYELLYIDGRRKKVKSSDGYYSTPEEAKESAIEYVLTNLIK